jgi:hypothetical protein
MGKILLRSGFNTNGATMGANGIAPTVMKIGSLIKMA